MIPLWKTCQFVRLSKAFPIDNCRMESSNLTERLSMTSLQHVETLKNRAMKIVLIFAK